MRSKPKPPGYYEEVREKKARQQRWKYQHDEAYRKKVLKERKQRYRKNSQYRKNTLELAKARYHEDPVYRAATIARAIERYRARKAAAARAKPLRQPESIRLSSTTPRARTA